KLRGGAAAGDVPGPAVPGHLLPGPAEHQLRGPRSIPAEWERGGRAPGDREHSAALFLGADLDPRVQRSRGAARGGWVDATSPDALGIPSRERPGTDASPSARPGWTRPRRLKRRDCSP